MIMQAIHFGFRVVEVPARTRYFPEASSASATQSIIYGCKTLATAARYVLHRGGLLRSGKFMPRRLLGRRRRGGQAPCRAVGSSRSRQE